MDEAQLTRGLHGLKIEARTRPVPEIVWPDLTQAAQLNLERARERPREMDESCMCEPASVRLSLQAMRLSYFKNSDFTPSLQRNITSQ